MNSGPPQLPSLVVGQHIRNGPFNITVTEAMVRQRERENLDLERHWREEQRQRHLIENQGEYFGEFKQLKVRRRFIRRVFFILTLQLIFTTLIIATCIYVEEAKQFVQEKYYLMIAALVVFMFTYLSISCCEYARRTIPYNILNLFFLTVSETYLTAFISSYYEVFTIFIAMGATALVTLIIFFTATITKFDLTKRLGSMMIISIISMFGIMAMIITFHFMTKSDRVYIQVTIGIVGAIVMSMYLFFDLQTIMGGKNIELSPDEIVYATAQLFVDILILYRYILQINNIIQN